MFIGRFQPVHKGHLHTIKQILERGEDLIIVIGSSQYAYTPDNPFTGGERVMFLKRAILDEGLPPDRIDIIPLPDINIHPIWVAHLKSFVPYPDRIDIIPLPDINIHPIWVAHLKSFVPYFDKAYTHNPLVIELLKDAGVKIEETELLDRSTFSARHIRDLLRWGGEWESLVPKGVAQLIKKHGLDKRVKDIGEVKTKR